MTSSHFGLRGTYFFNFGHFNYWDILPWWMQILLYKKFDHSFPGCDARGKKKIWKMKFQNPTPPTFFMQMIWISICDIYDLIPINCPYYYSFISFSGTIDRHKKLSYIIIIIMITINGLCGYLTNCIITFCPKWCH